MGEAKKPRMLDRLISILTGDDAPPSPHVEPPVYTAEQQALADKLAQYVWYHAIEVAEGVRTISAGGGFDRSWDLNRRHMAKLDFRGKRVLDVGCRDGMFSFEAERLGAAEVIAIDSDLSVGAVEFLIPRFKSKVQMKELNLYDLNTENFGEFDLILFLGVLYHLRYPFWGLKKIADCLKPGGELLIESGMLVDTPETESSELLFCPVENSPYEETSCTFFNRHGLTTTMKSFGFELLSHEAMSGECPSKDRKLRANRQIFHFRKGEIPAEKIGISLYWEKTHSYHTKEAATRHDKSGAAPPQG